MDSDIDINNLRWPKVQAVPAPSVSKKLPRHKPGQHFLKGPIPWNWLSKAAQLPGKALHVSVCLWYLAGLKSSRTIPLSMERLLELGVNRFAAYRGLKVLEEAGLVRVIRKRGRLSTVELLDCMCDAPPLRSNAP
jgi:hypothetical protein